MKDFNNDVSKLSMAEDIDEYEEEIIERDEYEDVDPEEEYYDEEAPEDEEFYDEETDEEYYEEEPQDEYYDEQQPEEYYDENGYDNQYYDERFNQVLDELADLKRSVGTSPAVVNQQPGLHPYVFSSQGNHNGSEVAMYNEISRLRDELNRTQNSQDLHIELGRLKEEMTKEQKHNESVLQSEIRRLNEKLEMMGGNSGHQRLQTSTVPSQFSLSGGLSDANVDSIRQDIGKLVAVNEHMAKSSYEVDAKMQKDIAELRRQLASLPDFSSLSKNVDALRSAMSKLDSGSVLKSVEEIKELVNSKSGESGSAVSSSSIDDAIKSIKNLKTANGGNNIGVLHRLYEIKTLIGEADANQAKHNAIVLNLLNEFAKVKYDIDSTSLSLADKLTSADKFAKKLAGVSETESFDIYLALDSEVANLLSASATEKSMNSYIQFLEHSKTASVSPQIKQAVSQFLTIAEELKKCSVEECFEPLNELIEKLNIIENNQYASDYDEMFASVTALVQEYAEAENEKIAGEIKGEIDEIIEEYLHIPLNAIYDYRVVKTPRVFKTYKQAEEIKSLSDKIDDIANLLGDISLTAFSGNSENAPADFTPVVNEINKLKSLIQTNKAQDNGDVLKSIEALKADVMSIGTFEEVLENIDALKADVLSIGSNEGLFEAIDALKEEITVHNNELIFARLDEIRDEIATAPNEETLKSLEDIKIELSQKPAIGELLENLDNLKADLILANNSEEIINHIESLKNDILSFNNNDELFAQIAEIKQDFADISDKLSILVDKAELDTLTEAEEEEAQLSKTATESELQVLDDLTYIREKLSEQDMFISQIADLRTEVLNLPAPVDAAELNNKIFDDFVAQLDKLYEDLISANHEADATNLKQLEDVTLLVNDFGTNIALKLDEVSSKLDDLSLLTSTKTDGTAESDTIARLDDIAESVHSANETGLSSALKLDEIANSVLSLSDAGARLDEIAASVHSANETSLNSALRLDEIANSVLPLSDAGTKIDEIAESIHSANETSLNSALKLDEIANSVLSLNDAGSKIDEIANSVLALNDTNIKLDDISLTMTDILTNYEKISSDISEIKEHVLTKELEVAAEAISSNDEEKSAIVREITDIREKLSLSSEISKEQSDMLIAQTNILLDEIENLKQTVTIERTSESEERLSEPATLDDATMSTLADINDKVNELLYGASETNQNNYQSIITSINDANAGISEVKDKLSLTDSLSGDLEKMLDDLSFIRSQIESAASEEVISTDSTADSINREELSIVMDDIAAIKEKILSANDELDLSAEIMSLHEEIRASRILDQNEVLRELETVHNELMSLKDDLAVVADIRNELNVYHDEVITTTKDKLSNDIVLPTNDEVNMILSEIVSLRDEIQSYKDEISSIAAQNTSVTEVADSGYNAEENINALFDEFTNLRVEIQGYNETAVNSQKQDLEEIKTTVDELKDVISRRTSIVEKAEGNAEASNELNVVLEEIIDVKNSLDKVKDNLNLVKAEQAATLDEEIQSIRQLLMQILADREEEKLKAEEKAVLPEDNFDAYASISAELDIIKNQISDLSLEKTFQTAEHDEKAEDRNSMLYGELSSIKDQIENISQIRTQNVDEVVLSEINSLRDQIDLLVYNQNTTVKEVAIDSESQLGADELSILLNEISMLREEIAQSKAETAPQGNIRSDEFNIIMNEFKAMREQLNSQQGLASEGAAPVAYDNSELLGEISSLREEIALLKSEPVISDNSELLGEISSLREEIALLKSEPVISDNSELLNEITSLREEMALLKSEPVIGDNSAILDELAALREEFTTLKATGAVETDNQGVSILFDEISSLRDQINNIGGAITTDNLTDNESVEKVLEEISSLRDQINNIGSAITTDNLIDNESVEKVLDELTLIKEQMQGEKISVQSDDTANILAEILALREEIDSLKSLSVSNTQKDSDESQDMLLEKVSAIRDEVRNLKEEPDLSVINEILALRDEFQAFKDEMATLRVAKDETAVTKDKSSNIVLDEVQSLRDQLFAISMASINDGTTNESTYESYNNIILDEISLLHDELNTIKSSQMLSSVIDEIAEIKESIAKNSSNEVIKDQLFRLKQDIESIKSMEASDATNNAILHELSNLKVELSNQRDADATTLNFMSEMAHLLERQNQYINQVASSKLSSEMENFKKEIAASLSNVPAFENSTSAIMNEISKLKEEIAQNSGEAIVIDNQAIVNELAKLKEEMSREKDSEENRLLLNEISRMKDEISVITEKENAKNSTSEDLSKSIHDLKNELNQIADFVSTGDDIEITNHQSKKSTVTKTGSKSTAAKKTTTGSKSNTTSAKNTSSGSSAKNTGAKQGESKTAKKSTDARKKATSRIETLLVDESNAETYNGDSLLSKIESEVSDFMKNEDSSNLHIDSESVNIGTTQDDIDLASRLARQVANKLIMEQLVQQLGDGGVAKSKIEEIVKDILPQEFTTVAMDEQSDKVRRLANSLVLDKLRSRLTNKK